MLPALSARRPRFRLLTSLLVLGAIAVSVVTSGSSATGLENAASGLLRTLADLDGEFMLTSYAALFAIVNPFVAIPIFSSLAEGADKHLQRHLNLVVCGTFMVTLTIAAVVGEAFLALFSLDVGAFRAAGGIILLLLAISLIQGQSAVRGNEAGSDADGSSRSGIAVFPLAIPLLAGPGAIATVVILCDVAQGAGDYASVAMIIIAMTATLYPMLALSPLIGERLGKTGMNVINRICGMIVAAIAMDTLARGIATMFPGIAAPSLT